MAVNSFQEERETPEYVTVAELADNVVIRIPACDDETVRRMLRDSYSEFCRLANALVTERTIPLEVGETDYPVVNMTPDCRVECVRAVFLNRHKLREGMDYRVGAGVPPMLTVNAIHLPARTTDERELVVSCLEMPNHGSENAPRWFIRKYGEAIVAGALIKLFSMSNRAWADQTQARLELGKWEGYVASARLGSMNGSPFGNGNFNTIDTSDLV